MDIPIYIYIYTRHVGIYGRLVSYVADYGLGIAIPRP